MPHTFLRETHALSSFDSNRRGFHHTAQLSRIPHDLPNDVHPIGGYRIGSRAHWGSSKKNRQNLAGPPVRDISHRDPIRGRFSIIDHTGNLEIEFFAPHINRSLNREHRIDRGRSFCSLELRFEPDFADQNANALRRFRHEAVQLSTNTFVQSLLRSRTLTCLPCEIKATIVAMLTSTFVLLQGVGTVTERRWWQEGVLDWHGFVSRPRIAGLSPNRKSLYNEDLSQALAAFEAKDFPSLAARLPGREHWRFYDTCRSTALYLDIETTGLALHDPAGAVTVVGLHWNGSTTTLVQGDTLTTDRLQAALDECTLLVTFFGSVFDVPYLRAKFPRLRFPMPHFDLCLAARRLGMHGGLKHLEQELGLDRAPALCGFDGLDAIRLWSRWRLGDQTALDVLLAYNRADTESLVPLATLVYSEMLSRFGPLVFAASGMSHHSLTAYAP